MGEKRDYYEILGIGRDAGQEDIKKACRNLALKYHPDRNPGDREAEDRFKEAAEAYEVLRDQEKRQIYDRFGHDGLQGAGFSGFGGFEDIFANFGDLFEGFFGTGRRRRSGPVRGSDLRYDLEIEFLEAAQGKEVELDIPRLENCAECGGIGSLTGEKKTCERCNGAGQVFHSQGFIRLGTTCPQCGGQGQIITDPCPECRGAGRVERKKTVLVRIPAGVDTGSRLRLRGEGEGGLMGGPPGDLHVVIHVRAHEFFDRDGDHVVCRIPISMVDAVLGAEVEVPTLKGVKKLKIPKGTQGNDTLRFRGEGFPNLRGFGSGDQVMEIKVLTPTDLTDKQKELLREFAALEQEKSKKSWFRKAAGAIKESIVQ